MRTRLTERQNQVYEYVRAHVRQHGKPPTLQEIGRALAIRSTNGVHKLLVALETKGYVRRTPNEARGLALVGAAEDPFAFDGGAPALPLVSRTSSREPERLRLRPAGALHVDPRLLDRADPDACLVARAGDDGMNGDGVRKGDYLVVEEADFQTLRNGEVVAVLLEERLVARRFDLANGRLHLRPADRTYAEEVFAPGDPGCHVVGRVRAVLRKL
jgi:repressor LexA